MYIDYGFFPYLIPLGQGVSSHFRVGERCMEHKDKKQWEMDWYNVTRLAENHIHYTCDYDEIDFETRVNRRGVHVCDYWI